MNWPPDHELAIYGLFHDGKCRYVGRTSNTYARRCDHSTWFKAAYGNLPEFRVFRFVAPAIASDEEAKTIRWFKSRGQAERNRLVPRRVKDRPILKRTGEKVTVITVDSGLHTLIKERAEAEGVTIQKWVDTALRTVLKNSR